MKCKRVSPHCRTIKSGSKAKSPCTKNGKSGTKVRGFYSPKASCKGIVKIQAAVRGHQSRSKSKSKSKFSPRHTAASKIASLFKKNSKRKSDDRKRKARMERERKRLA